MTIDELAIKHNTDKSSLDHNYTFFYQKHFDKYITNPKKILEMGIYSLSHPPTIHSAGASLKTWSDYFPQAEVIGLDIIDYSNLNEHELYPRIKTMSCNGELRDREEFNQITNPWLKELYVREEMIGGLIGLDEVIKKFGENYDIIIDDGPHTMSSQQKFLGFMFKYLKSGGVFVIEDIHTSYSNNIDRTGQLQYNSFPHTDKTTLWVFQNYLNTKKIESDFITEDEINYLENNISEIYLEKAKNSEIVFIIKK